MLLLLQRCLGAKEKLIVIVIVVGIVIAAEGESKAGPNGFLVAHDLGNFFITIDQSAYIPKKYSWLEKYKSSPS